LLIDHELVSAQHAVVRWTGNEWSVRDLGSRNGTFVEGVRITHVSRPLQQGSKIWFGSPEVEWRLADAAAPRPWLISVDDGSSLMIEGEMLALPSFDNPLATVFRDGLGVWHLEQATGARPLGGDDTTFEVGGRTWRFRSSAHLAQTTGAAAEGAETPRLTFKVTSDEEHVDLSAEVAGQRVELGTSSRYYLLLTLARQRSADREQGLPETSCGWVFQEDLQKALVLGQQHLNIEVFRIRRQLSEKGLPGAATVIERRVRSRQIRLGWGNYEIQRI